MGISTGLAVGAVAAALILAPEAAGAPRLAASVLLAAVALAAASWLAGLLWRGRAAASRRRGAIAIAAGTGAIALRLVLAPPVVPAIDVPLPPGDGPWSAVVISVGPLREGNRPAVVELGDPAGIRLAATLPAWPAVVPGDRISISGELEPRPEGEYGAYLARIGAAGIVRSRSVEVVGAGVDAARSLEGLRRGADEALRLAIPEPEAGLASGILIGLRDRVDRELAAAFTTVGASHVVAISGWNIAIVAATLGALAGRLARRRRAALTAAAIVAYVVFVGASPSVVRAAAMAGVVLLARELGRPSRAAAAIGWAVALLLLVDPRLIDDIGFRLSAVATAGLIVWGTPLTARLSGPAPGRVRAWLAESLGVSLAAQLATLPIVAFEFGRLSIVAPVVNLGVVPLVAPAMAAGAVALATGSLALAGLPGIVATIGGLPAWALLAGIVGLVRAGATVPFASLELAPPWDAGVGVGAAAVIVLADRLLRRRAGTRGRPPPAPPAGTTTPPARTGAAPPHRAVERGLAIGMVAAVVALGVAVVHRPDGIPRLVVFDVGQGDAILVEGERGGRLLVDGGPDPGRLLVALDEHLPPWDRRIDVVVLSHPHEDHAAGLAALLARYGVDRVIEPGMTGPGPGYAALSGALAGSAIERGTLSTGDRLAVDGIRLTVLWPDIGSVPETPPDGGTGINNVSIVLLGESGRHRFLLTGDIEEEIDPTILGRGLGRVDVLKVAHHGSRTATTEAFVEALRPSVAVVSAGRGNPYGHPAPATVARLEAAGARVLRTDRHGTVEIELGPGPIRVRSEGSSTAAAGGPGGAGVGIAAASPVPPGASSLAFVCGIPAAGESGLAATADPPSAVPVAPVRRPATDRTGTLRYHAPRDLPTFGPSAAPAALERPAEPRRWACRDRRRHRGTRAA
ncbi:MAG TPA: ComEC/Rec2 family competence protein [Candidatus Limnocylindrales bacterium]|nr:ComEC/Rec2 family competence protein [Candidatus Limnocylindrales bacterium]